MRSFHRVKTRHEDLIRGVVYDFCGRRIATYSLDGKIMVWGLDDLHGWSCIAIWEWRCESILSVDWASPEFGQLIASSSSDGMVCIWKERNEGEERSPQKLPQVNGNELTVGRWEKKAIFEDCGGPVYSVKFAPSNQGLRLATASDDGFVRIYETNDIFDSSKWYLADLIDMNEFYGDKGGVRCLSWNTSVFDQPSFVVCSSNSGKAHIWQYNEKTRKWAVICAFGSEKNDVIINDVSWAPFMGDSYYLIASANGKDGAKIWCLKVNDKDEWTVEKAVELNHDTAVRGLSWDMTGTILATFGDDGAIRMWKAGIDGLWTRVDIIKNDVQNNINSI